MKPNRWNRFLAAFQSSSVSSALVVGFAGMLAGPASSATLTWDIAPGTVGAGNGTVTGGAGNWDTTPSLGNWTTDGGANNVAWVNNVTPDGAIFEGTGGTVTQAGVVANSMTFNVAGYTVTGGTLTLGGTTPTITANSDATISSVLAGTAGMTKAGSGILSIPTKATYTGGTIVNAGVLNLSGGGGQGGTIRGAVTVNAGSILNLNTGDATGWGTGADRLSTINLVGGNLNVATTSNQTLGDAVVTMTGSSITGVSGSNLDFFQTTSALTSLASATTSTISGTRLSIRQAAGLTVTVADGTTPSDIDLDVNSVVASNGSFATAPLIKAGTGTLRLNGANTYSGPTTINGGAFILGAAGTAPNSDITANTGTTLRLANAGKTLKSLTLNTGTTLGIGAKKLTTTTVTNALATHGTITIKPEFLDVPAPAEVYNLATAASSSGTPTFTVDTSGFGASRITGTAAVTGNILQLTIGTGAANLIWNNNATTGIWNHNTDANFDNAGSPDVFKSFDGVTFDGTAAGTVTLVGSLYPSATTVSSSSGDYTFAGSGSLAAGILTKSGISTLTVGTTNSHPSTVITGGVLNATAASATGGGLTTVSGGTLNANVANATGGGSTTVSGGTLNIGNAAALGTGTLVLNSGTFDNTTGAAATLGNSQTWNGSFAFTGTQNLTTSGTIALTGNSQISVDANSLIASGVISGAFNLAKTGAGTLQLNAAHTYSGTTSVSGAGRLFVTNSLRNTTSFTAGSGSTLEFGATNIFTSGHGTAMGNGRVITVNGGTLLMNNLFDCRFGNVTLNDGATWTSNRGLGGYDALLANTDAGAATVTVGGSGTSTMNGTGGIHLQGVQNFAVADSSGNANPDLNVNMILGNQGTQGGAAGGINKTGAGTMVLNAVNNFAGATTVNDGTLVIGATGSANASAFTVNAGTLQIDTTGKTVASLAANAGATLTVAATKLATTNITGALVTAGAITLKPLFTDFPASGDAYDLFSAASFTDGGIYTVDMSSRGTTRVTGTAAADGNFLVVTIGTGGADLTWTNGAATGIWNHNADQNFLNGASPDVFLTYDSVTFGNTAAGIVNLAGTLYPGTVTVNSTADYTFAGAGSLGGGTLVKAGTSTLNLTTAQSPARVILNDGTLNVAHASALGTASVTLTGGLFNNGTGGTLTLANAHTWDTAATFTGSDLTLTGAVTLAANTDVTVGPSALTVSGAINGASGTLVKKGAGTMTLNGAANSSLGGGLTVEAGTVAVATGTGASLIEVGTGPTLATLTIDGNQQVNRTANLAAITIGSNGTMIVNGVNALPSHFNSDSFTVEAGGLLSFVSGGSTAIGATGISHGHLNNLILNGGTVSLPYSGTGTAYFGESVQLNGNVTVGGSTPSTIQFGAGATTANAGISLRDATTHTFTVADVTGDADADLVVSAELEDTDTGTGSFIKDGPGTMSLAGGIAHSLTGSTTVTAGTLAATGSIAGPLIVEAAGTIAPGASAGDFGAGATTITGTYACEIDGLDADTLVITGNLTINAGSTLDVSEIGAGATEDLYVIATYTGTRSGTFEFSNLPAGYGINYNDSLKQVELATGTSYATWIGGFPGAAGEPGFDQDADKDGIDNGVEHVLGTDPSASTTGLYQVSATANSVTFRHTQTNELALDVTKSYEWSSDLVEWEASGVANTGGTIGTIVATTITDNSAPANDVIEVVVTRTGTASTKLFCRLVATQ